MTTKLASKHKDSLSLKENKPFGRNCITHKQCKRWELLLPWTTFTVFLVYWFILCPLLWATCLMVDVAFHRHWFWIFWMVAFLIWIVIMCVLIILWRRFLAKQSLEINTISKYGSHNVGRPLSSQQIFEGTELLELKRNDFHFDSKKSARENLRKDLPPLVIHKQISGENIEDAAGVVRVDEDEKTRLSVVTDYTENSPLQDYLKLVTISPSEEEVKSPKSPMSPRELFFIDLIREADRAESARSLKTRSLFFPREETENDMKRRTHFFPSEATEDDIKTRAHFFPSEATEKDNTETVKGEKDEKDEKDMKDVKRRKKIKDTEDAQDEKDSKSESKRESIYFIADVESPATVEKTEVFLQIDSDVGAETGLIAEKPLILQFNEADLQERN